MSNIFADEAWEEYVEWQIKDKKIAMHITGLLEQAKIVFVRPILMY